MPSKETCAQWLNYNNNKQKNPDKLIESFIIALLSSKYTRFTVNAFIIEDRLLGSLQHGLSHSSQMGFPAPPLFIYTNKFNQYNTVFISENLVIRANSSQVRNCDSCEHDLWLSLSSFDST